MPAAARPDWTGRPLLLLTLGAGFATLLVSRNPDVLARADFWGEDGWVWYPQAYNDGWASLLRPETGYLQTVSRIGGELAQLVPFAWAPTLFALVALVVQVLPPVFLVSSRMAPAWPRNWARLAFAAIYVALPNSREVFVNLTNAQWHLAALGFLIVVSAPPRVRAEQAFDAAFLLLGGLSGPFCLLLLPIAAWQLAETRSRTARWRLGVLLATGLVQAASLALTIHARADAPLGAGAWRLARILAQNIVLAVLLGQHSLPGLLGWPPWQASDALPAAVTLAGLLLVGVALWRGPALLRKAFAFAALSLAAALSHPQISVTVPQWQMMTLTGWGDRYFVFPMLAWIGVLFALAGARQPALSVIGGALLALMLVHVPGEWRYPPMAATDFAQRAREFAAAPAGAVVKLQMHPDGAVMWMVKRPD